MGLRFRKSVQIAKGVKLNLNKSSTSITFGTRGLHYTISSTGKKTTSVGIPGTGLSYVTTTGGSKKKKSSGSSSTNRSQAQKDAEYDKNLQIVEEYEERIEEIKSIHEICSEPVDWQELKDQPEPFPYLGGGPLEKEARANYDAYEPTFIEKLNPAKVKEKQDELEDAISQARQQDQQDYSDWQNLHALAQQVLAGDIDSYFYVIDEMKPYEDILDFGSNFDVGTDSPDFLEVEYHAKTARGVPDRVVSLTQTGKLSSKEMTKTMHYDLAQDYICSCTLRIAREMFALLPIETVVIHVEDTVEDDSGKKHDDTVLSVLIERNQLERINFDHIDTSITIESFQCNMNFKKTQGLKPVERIEI